MATVKKSAGRTKQHCLSASDPSPKYILTDILEIRKFPLTLLSTATRITEIIIIGITLSPSSNSQNTNSMREKHITASNDISDETPTSS
jgi:hypothetical protein